MAKSQNYSFEVLVFAKREEERGDSRIDLSRE
jgi:hypothetical protein